MDAPVETIDDLLSPDISLQPELFEIGGRTVTAPHRNLPLKKRTDGKEGYDRRQALYQDYVDRGYEKIKGRMIPLLGAWDNRGIG